MISGVRTHSEHQWQRGGWLCPPAGPTVRLTLLAVSAKRAFTGEAGCGYYRPPVPVIIVGNIYVGGAGKTPVVIAMVKALRRTRLEPRRIRPRIRGEDQAASAHGNKDDLAAERFGDAEPALIAHATNLMPPPSASTPTPDRAGPHLVERLSHSVSVVVSEATSTPASARWACRGAIVAVTNVVACTSAHRPAQASRAPHRILADRAFQRIDDGRDTCATGRCADRDDGAAGGLAVTSPAAR